MENNDNLNSIGVTYDEFLEKLGIMANVLQVGSFVMNAQQISNDDLMKALDEQNSIYLREILSNQKKILDKLDIIIERG